MRKNSIRKFVHAVLDLIPLFIIPIFAIYTRNENYNSNIEVQVEHNIQVDFNQQAYSNNIGTYNSYGVSLEVSNTNVIANGTNNNQAWSYVNFGVLRTDLVNHIIVIRGCPINGSNTTYFIRNGYSSAQDYGNGVRTKITGNFILQICVVNGTYVNNLEFVPQYYDLTQMYGVGNEPTLEDFNATFTNAYYPYTESEIQFIPTTPITYNDTDVGSQFVYTLYNATDKYFNMNNVFNMNDVYDWFVLNIFGGNAPLGIYIVWNIVLYEFVMDLLMLLYGVFMFFIDCCTNLIEKPLNAIK